MQSGSDHSWEFWTCLLLHAAGGTVLQIPVSVRRWEASLVYRKASLVCRIMGWVGLEGTAVTILFQPCCHGQGHLPLDQVVQMGELRGIPGGTGSV